MKFFVTGSAGLVGRQVTKDLVALGYQVYSSYHINKPEFGTPTHLDLTNPENITRVIDSTNPDVIIHLAALTNVDLCEKEKEMALLINAKASEILSKQATRKKAFFLYVSTDYVFDGEEGMKKESDTPNPVDFYGKSKLEGEKAVAESASSWCIARTSTPFGLHSEKISFPLWVIQNLEANKEIPVVVDQFTSPTYVPNLSLMLIELCTRKIVGINHVAGRTKISRHKFAESIAENLNLDKKLLKPVSMKDMKWFARRPKDSSLDVSKAFSILKEKPLSIDKALESFIRDIKPL